MRKTDHTPDFQRLRRLITEALAIADTHRLLDIGICLDSALVRLSEIEGLGSGFDNHSSVEASDQINH
ncbi:hypothetical protein [Sphingomonas sp. SORGH_AS_0879]|uniref:hypothetical protein n=1 Tax=Sphingomonas sp. SORGH_AS_0879 TaxID=3041790 RepID=UPI002782F8F0|nr:hypothetical protein [Sphingomonas sp. SORGH_AS_0879]MDQ1231716.1 hypothetical protein [Sphingomonas sp. SORGH_AS_0879]